MAEQSDFTQERALKQLKISYEMYENTKKQTEERMRDALNSDGTKKFTEEKIKEELSLIKEAQDDVVRQYVECGGKEEDIRNGSNKKNQAKNVIPSVSSQSQNAREIDMIEQSKKETIKNAIEENTKMLEKEYNPVIKKYDSDVAFDVIPLPSKGEGYKDKISKVSVSYLTAYDENMIVSPNLYRDNLVIDYILQEKLLSQEIQPIDLLEGDRDAIVLFLRASGYGNEYPIAATDDATGTEFETVVDLSKLKYKDFNLKGDTNGWFEYKLPVTGKVVKFRFPTHRDVLLLEKMQKSEEKKLKKETIKEYVSVLDDFIESDDVVDTETKIKVRQSIRAIEKWGNGISDEEVKFNHALTNRLNLLIMAVDGITDREYIYNFIKKMPVKDSSSLRKYMQKNEPGIDYTITVNRPESLGGGSFETFLQLDKFLFLNITD